MKRLLKPFWRMTFPIRARLYAKLDSIVYHAADRAVAAHDPVPAVSIDVANHFRAVERRYDEVSKTYGALDRKYDEVTLVLDAVMAEQFRLQSQIEVLERRL